MKTREMFSAQALQVNVVSKPVQPILRGAGTRFRVARRMPFLIAGLLAFVTSSAMSGYDRVIVESKTVRPNDTGVCLGVYMDTDKDYYAIVLPFEIRSVSGGAFIANRFRFEPRGRVAASDLMDQVFERFRGTPKMPNSCSGPESQTYSTDAPLDFISPDGYMWAAVSHHDWLPSGSDGPVGSGTPSFVFYFDVNGFEGAFEIDTCCFTPANHLSFLDYSLSYVTFVKSIITVDAACWCPCHGDPVCDSVADVQDVVSVIDEAFNGVVLSLDTGCPILSRADLNCDCLTNVLDVVIVVGRVFRGVVGLQCSPCEVGGPCCPYCL